ncbi:hypothetical protein HGA91_03505 [candidate division WWE3 bacterium]|nr:hypothetical protein [candidate division WWE3 bacterium]
MQSSIDPLSPSSTSTAYDNKKTLFGLAVGLTVITIAGLLTFTAPLKTALFQSLYPKPLSSAAQTVSLQPTYLTKAIVNRSKPTETGVWVNNTNMIPVNALSNWNAEVDIHLGSNTLNVSYRNQTGTEVDTELLTITRHGEADINGDTKVNVFDLGILIGKYNTLVPTNSSDTNLLMADINSDKKVDVFDLGVLSGKYDQSYLYPTAIPTVTASITPSMAGFGIMGDSSSDEYSADDNRGGSYATTTLNWNELLTKYRSINFGPQGNRSEPRRSGFEYNTARSGATTFDMISTGQHTIMANLIKTHKVTQVYLSIGANDFAWYNGNYAKYYNGEYSGDSLKNQINAIAQNIITAVDTVRAAGDVRIIVTDLMDTGIVPEVAIQFPDPAKRKNITDAVAAINEILTTAMNEREIPLISVNSSFYGKLLSRMNSQGQITVSGEIIKTLEKGNEPHYGRLDDVAGHLGTVLSGMYANELFINPFFTYYGITIEPFTDQELISHAGINTIRTSN